MRVLTDKHNQDAVRILMDGGVGILRTDTLYGIVARADNEQAVERVYRLKNRNHAKSPIVLIGSTEQLFDEPTEALKAKMRTMWPGKVSIIVPSTKAPHWLTRSNKSVAYRLPADQSLRQLVAQAGPLIAPSANPEGGAPAMNIREAVEYFGETVDFYIDEGQVTDDAPSQLLRLTEDGEIERLR